MSGELTGQKIVASRWTTRQPPPPRGRCGVCDSLPTPTTPAKRSPNSAPTVCSNLSQAVAHVKSESNEAQWGAYADRSLPATHTLVFVEIDGGAKKFEASDLHTRVDFAPSTVRMPSCGGVEGIG